jgi:hypothetical protein
MRDAYWCNLKMTVLFAASLALYNAVPVQIVEM